MAEGATTAEQDWDVGPSLDDLEQRVQRLEDVVAAICDTQALEERVLAKLQTRLQEMQQTSTQAQQPTEPSPVPPTGGGGSGVGIAVDSLSLFAELWHDVRTFWRMLRDPLYRMSWTGRLVGLLPLGYAIWTTLGGFRNLFGLLYLVDLALFLPFVFVAFKVWGRELRRYRRFLHDRSWSY